jgi:hypothetical protein
MTRSQRGTGNGTPTRAYRFADAEQPERFPVLRRPPSRMKKPGQAWRWRRSCSFRLSAGEEEPCRRWFLGGNHALDSWSASLDQREATFESHPSCLGARVTALEQRRSSYGARAAALELRRSSHGVRVTAFESRRSSGGDRVASRGARLSSARSVCARPRDFVRLCSDWPSPRSSSRPPT